MTTSKTPSLTRTETEPQETGPFFPLPDLDEDSVAAMHRTWERHCLERYLLRWKSATVPTVPEAFWRFPWRGCDLGCGFGKYLLDQSREHPQRAYLGLDKGVLRGGNMCRRFDAAARPNLFGLHGNAIPIMAAMPDGGLDEITLFYPNPWWPKKHRKKRWPYHPLLPKLIALLKPSGRLILTSNERFYLTEWVYAMASHPAARSMQCNYLGPVRTEEGRTHFEVKFLAEGTPCGEAVYRKRATAEKPVPPRPDREAGPGSA